MIRSIGLSRTLPYVRAHIGRAVAAESVVSLRNSQSVSCILQSSRSFSDAAVNSSLRRDLRSGHSLLLQLLPRSATNASLQEALQKWAPKRVELEPGCAVHVSDHAEIDLMLQGVHSDLQVSRTATIRPGLKMQNIPSNVDINHILQALAPFGAVAADVSGVTHATINCSSIAEVNSICSALSQSEEPVLFRVQKGSKDSYLVKVFNFPEGSTATSVQTLCEKAGAKKGAVSVISPANPALSLRFEDETAMNKARAALQSSPLAAKTQPNANGRWHAVWFKNVTDEAEVTKALQKHAPVAFVPMKTLSGVPTGNAVAYFNTKAAAYRVINELSDRAFGSLKLQANYKPAPMFAVRVRNLAPEVTKEDLEAHFRTYYPLKVVLEPRGGQGDDATREAVVYLRAQRDEAHAIKTKDGIKINDKRMKLENATRFSPVLTVQDVATRAQKDEILNTLRSAGVDVVSSELLSDANVTITFPTTWEARKALIALRHGEVQLASGASIADAEVITVKLDSPTLQVFGLSGETSVDQFISGLQSTSAPLGITTSRTAFVKFSALKETRTALHELRREGIQGNKIRAQHYVPFADQETEFDESPEWMKAFDQEMLSYILTEQGDLDPATRYRLAVNHIEREFRDLTRKDADQTIMKSLPSDVRKMVSSNDPDGLLRIILNNEDYRKFSQSIDEISHVTGLMPGAPGSDPWDMTNFTAKTWDDEEMFHKLLDEMKDEIAIADRADKLKKRASKLPATTADLVEGLAAAEGEERDDLPDVNTFGSEDTPAAAAVGKKGAKNVPQGTIHISQLSGDIKHLMKIDPSTIIDYDGKRLEAPASEKKSGFESGDTTIRDAQGRLWSGAIVKTGTTQKVVAGGRIMSYKTLVVIGNGNGAGGFGSGKGATPADALEAAFRDAQKNIQFFEAYEGSALTHDLYGKHNSCQVYIRAVPAERGIKAGPIVEAILTRFGIAAASAKVVGRRNPYSVVLATFKALSKHESLEESAKKRGKRFLDVEWARKNNL